MPRVWLACLCVGRRLPAFNSWDLDEAGSRNNFPGTQRQRPCARAAAHVAVPAAARAVRRVGRRPAGGEARRGKRAARAGACLPAGPGASSLTHSQGWRSAEKEVSCGLQSTPSLSRSRPTPMVSFSIHRPTRPGRWIAPAQKERRSSPSQRVVIGGNECADVPGRGRPGQREYIAKGWLVCPAIIDARW